MNTPTKHLETGTEALMHYVATSPVLDIAVEYRWWKMTNGAIDWALVNRAIVKRFSKTTLQRIKRLAAGQTP